MKILVLGGGGFLGLNLSKSLLNKGYDVRIFERPGRTSKLIFENSPKMDWHEGDFANENDIESAIKGCDAIYHLISTTIPMDSNDNPIYDIESNLISSIKMLDIARKQCVKKVIFISSGGTVYGIPHKIPIPEDHPKRPVCSYGIIKLTIEKYLHLFHENGGPDYTILRLSNPFGRYQLPDASQGAVAVFINNALNGNPIEVWGDGSVVRDFIFVDDVIDAMVQALIYRGKDKIFNIGSGSGLSLNDIIESIEVLLGRKVMTIYTGNRSCDVPINVLDIKKAKHTLGWMPATGFKDGLKKYAKYLNTSN